MGAHNVPWCCAGRGQTFMYAFVSDSGLLFDARRDCAIYSTACLTSKRNQLGRRYYRSDAHLGVGWWRLWNVRWVESDGLVRRHSGLMSETCINYVNRLARCSFYTSGVRIWAWRGRSGPLAVITCGYYPTSAWAMLTSPLAFARSPTGTPTRLTTRRMLESSQVHNMSSATLESFIDGAMSSYSRTNEGWADTRLSPLKCGESSNERG